MLPGPRERVLVGGGPDEADSLAAEVLTDALSAPAASKAVALAGGATPALLYRTLSRPPFRDRIQWREVHWFWGDERTVPPDHPDSNYRMTMEALLNPLDVPTEHIHRMPADNVDLEAAAREYEQTIRQYVSPGAGGIPAFDFVLLGVGADGHTASLFPGSAALNETERLVVPNYAPSQNAWRLTMTFPLLLAARHILFFVTGEAKAQAIGRILVGNEANLPATAFRNAPGQLTWVLDAGAARLLPARPGL